MTALTSRDSDKFMLRLPDGMRARLKEEAEKNGRSMNAEIVHRLEATLVTGKMTAADFLGVMDANYVNATKIAAILREALQRVEDLSTGSVRADDISDG